MVRRAEETQPRLGLVGHLLQQRLGDARLANARVACDQDDGAAARLCLLPAPPQQCDLFLATNQWRAGGPKGLEPIAIRARTQDTPDVHRMVNSCDRQSAEIAIVKQAAQQAARIVCNHNRVRFGGPLQPCRKISRLTNDRLFLGRALTKEITDHDEARRDADTHLQRDRLARIELGYGLGQGEARAHRLFGVLLMRLRVTEIGQHAVAEILRDKAAGP